jgi:hypothetical protein
MKVRIAFFLFCLAAASALPAEETWEGNAAVIRRGVFELPGLYAASDSFPKNSLILVENIQTGEQVEVTILERINGSGNVFLLLSEQAAKRIGLSSDEVLPVRARVKMSPAVGALGLPDDLTENPDPDVNPAAAVPETAAPATRVAETSIAEASPAEAAVAEAPPAEAAAAEPEPEPEPEPPAASTAVEAVVAAAPEEDLSPEEQRLEEVSSRLPQKQVYMPPREDEIYLAAEPEPEPEPEPPAIVAAEPEPEPEPEPEAELSLAAAADTEMEEQELELPGLEQIEPRETRGMEARPAPRGEVVSGPTAMPALPAETVEEEPAEVVEEAAPEEFQLAELVPPAAEEPAPAPEETGLLPLVESLPPSSYFLQLAAFSGRQRAEKLVADLEPVYTVAVLPVMRQNRRLYKVLIGPLNQEESGTLLYRFRSLGYKDAFITQSD